MPTCLVPASVAIRFSTIPDVFPAFLLALAGQRRENAALLITVEVE